MRRHSYPYGRYRIEGGDPVDLGDRLRRSIESLGYPVIKFSRKNEGDGTLIIAVNKKIMKLLAQRKPAGRLQMMLSKMPLSMGSFRELITSDSSLLTTSLREMDLKSQRAGIEMYLWPIKQGVLLEIFILPYMESLNRAEIPGITQSKDEEITDWCLCEKLWQEIVPPIIKRFDLVPVRIRE